MSSEVVVDKGRDNTITVDLGFDITGDTIRSEIRAEEDQESALIATWDVSVVTANVGAISLNLSALKTSQIVASSGFMDIVRISNGKPLSVFSRPLRVTFQGTVTADE